MATEVIEEAKDKIDHILVQYLQFVCNAKTNKSK